MQINKRPQRIRMTKARRWRVALKRNQSHKPKASLQRLNEALHRIQFHSRKKILELKRLQD
jgi:hypothetical protein